MGGVVTDPSGAVISNARVTVTSPDGKWSRTTATDNVGRWQIAGMPSGAYKLQTEMRGFQTSVLNLNYDANQPANYNTALNVGSTNEMVMVEVTAEASEINTSTATVSARKVHGSRANTDLQSLNTPSANVVDLQKRVAGVLPVAIDIPRAGTSFSFVRPLVLDEETRVTFSYKSR
jgi:hypothetical protein